MAAVANIILHKKPVMFMCSFCHITLFCSTYFLTDIITAEERHRLDFSLPSTIFVYMKRNAVNVSSESLKDIGKTQNN
ncbi:hypothetical protein RO3G_12283 [Rhizopus delemar RA 99-880]|uniref:Uncharacterized protein n=1 Tax=Rhizopus delemar (strain RA 99-880 / ATCC MYA-4621 / FGSC 9543 / NRRL 43880) TaxID=246409 RepID=I1CGJ2_RHIO9|nr:hypothetical protein RO3G_12283 [Rhizopus delemar RA 99-880]|eukprot:EIE87572.1 hypothetical protein RO3G_12283 [Rhizopus delemar RA 99-880]